MADELEVTQIELLCKQLYESQDPHIREQAEKAVIAFQEALETPIKCQALLERADSSYSQLLAATTLAKLLSRSTTSLSTQQRLYIRNYVLNYLATRPKLAPFVVQSLVSLFARITKLGWFDVAKEEFVFHNVMNDIGTFLQGGAEQCTVGVQLLSQLVLEMNHVCERDAQRSLSKHRSIASSFRDTQLFEIFRLACSLLSAARKKTLDLTDSTQHTLVESLLKLAHNCLTFDFIGTMSDESSDDLCTVQIPTSWRPTFLKSGTLDLFFELYHALCGSLASLSLACLVQLASVRRSLFSNNERAQFLNRLAQGVHRILENTQGLSDPTNYHEFCRLLAGLKSNYQLGELVMVDNYPRLIELIAKFTVQSLQMRQFAPNSVHYLLTLWQRMVTSVPYVKATEPHLLETYAPSVCQAYIESRLDSVAVVLRDGLEDPLDDIGSVQQQLEQVSVIGRCQYSGTCTLLENHLDRACSQYSQGDNSPALLGELTWLVYIIGAAISGRATMTTSEDHDSMDGSLVCRVLQLAELADCRPPCDGCEKLDLAMMWFFEQFRKIYVGEQDQKNSKVFRRLSEVLGINDESQLLSVVMRKIHTKALTPGGSMQVTGTIPAIKTPEGNVRCLPQEPKQPLGADVLDRVEAMNMSNEEAMAKAPWHMRRWMEQLGEGVEDPENPDELTCPKASAEPSVGAVSVAKDDFVEDVRPSTSGMVATSRAMIANASAGSEMDSDSGDEVDGMAEQFICGTGRHRDISDSEQLDEPVREMILAVERAMDDVADQLGVSTSYEWQHDFESFSGVSEAFSGPNPGPVKDYDTPYDAFTDVWSIDIMRRIAEETNRYAEQTINNLKARGTLKPSSRLHKWTPTDADEIAVLFSVYMYMAIDPRSSQHEYWKADDYLEMPKFRLLMSYNRYILLSKFLHFVDNSQNYSQIEGNLSPRLAKLAPIIVHLNNKFSTLYNMERDICVDESLTLFKGRLSWVQTIRSKAARFGIKSYELCESRTGYMHQFQIYTGKTSNSSGDDAPSVDLEGKSTKVVLDLLKDLAHRGHCVTMDNFYNCPALARYLKSKGFDCFGTLRTNRRNVPSEIAKVPKSVAKGHIIARQCGDISIIAWKDSKLVTMISTYHTDETCVVSKAGKVLVKPVCVRDYNHTMGGVDLKDQKLSMYLLERKRGVKWYIKMFKRLLNVSIHNAYVLSVRSLARRDKLKMTHREFRYKLAKSLVEKHRRSQPMVRIPQGPLKRLRKDLLHEPKFERGSSNRKRCVVCYESGKTKLVNSQCATCGVFLCFEKCWRDWHSLSELKTKGSRGRKRRRIEGESTC